MPEENGGVRKITRVVVFRKEDEIPEELRQRLAPTAIEGEYKVEGEYEELPAWKERNGGGGGENGHG
jgi:hypothetical protein